VERRPYQAILQEPLAQFDEAIVQQAAAQLNEALSQDHQDEQENSEYQAWILSRGGGKYCAHYTRSRL
jgi:hypothetical protein